MRDCDGRVVSISFHYFHLSMMMVRYYPRIYKRRRMFVLLLLQPSSGVIVHEHWTKITKMTIGGHYTIRYSLYASTQILTSNIMQSWNEFSVQSTYLLISGQSVSYRVCGKIRSFPPDGIQSEKREDPLKRSRCVLYSTEPRDPSPNKHNCHADHSSHLRGHHSRRIVRLLAVPAHFGTNMVCHNDPK